jgi:hydrogenase maturation protease
MAEPVRIVGCGRYSMGDDQAGLIAADGLRKRRLPGVAVVSEEVPGSTLAAGLPTDVELLVIVDAARANADHPAGSHRRIVHGGHEPVVLTKVRDNTHSLGVDMGLELAAALGTLPTCVWIYVIFGEYFGRSMEVGQAVRAGIPAFLNRIERDVRQWVENRPCMS